MESTATRALRAPAAEEAAVRLQLEEGRLPAARLAAGEQQAAEEGVEGQFQGARSLSAFQGNFGEEARVGQQAEGRQAGRRPQAVLRLDLGHLPFALRLDGSAAL